MAHTDACKIQVCQLVKRCTDNGMSILASCKAAQKESDGIPARTIQRWWYEILKESEVETAEEGVFKNEQFPTPSPSTEIPENQEPTPRKHVATGEKPSGGPREGAGRPPKAVVNKESIVSEEFTASFNAMLRAVTNAKRTGWRETSKEAVIKHLGILYDITTIK